MIVLFAVFDEKEHFSVLVNVLQQLSFDLYDIPNHFTDIGEQVLLTDLNLWDTGRCIVALVLKLFLNLILDVEVEVAIPLEEGKQERIDQSWELKVSFFVRTLLSSILRLDVSFDDIAAIASNSIVTSLFLHELAQLVDQYQLLTCFNLKQMRIFQDFGHSKQSNLETV